MRLEQCEKCAHFAPRNSSCGRNGKPIASIRGCAYSSSGQKFFRSRSGKEAYRLNVLGKNKGETKS